MQLKNKYQSEYGCDRKLNAAERVAEIFTANHMRYLGRQPFDNFWLHDKQLCKEVKQHYKQILPLIKKYGEIAVLNAVNSTRMRNAWSVKFPGFEHEVILQVKEFERLREIKPPVIDGDRSVRRPEFRAKPPRISRLR